MVKLRGGPGARMALVVCAVAVAGAGTAQARRPQEELLATEGARLGAQAAAAGGGGCARRPRDAGRRGRSRGAGVRDPRRVGQGRTPARRRAGVVAPRAPRRSAGADEGGGRLARVARVAVALLRHRPVRRGPRQPEHGVSAGARGRGAADREDLSGQGARGRLARRRRRDAGRRSLSGWVAASGGPGGRVRRGVRAQRS